MRRSTLLALFLWSGGLQAAEVWLPLNQALKAAETNNRLILLYLRADEKNDEWIAHADSNEALRRVLGEFVTSRETPSVAGTQLVDLLPFRTRRSSSLLLLDPGGGLLTELKFTGYGEMAGTLGQIRRLAPGFAKSAKARAEGKTTESLLLRANSLLYSGVRRADLFQQVLTRARAERNEVFAQDAEIGLATVTAYSRRTYDAMRMLKRVADKPATPELGARAWILLGHERKSARDTRGAVEAYQNAYRLTPPPSLFAEEARRYLEMIGSAPQADVSAAVAAGAVRLLYPHQAVLAGDVEVSAAAPPGAARVEFYLDDARVTNETRAPFTTKIALGAVPRVHTIKAMAFDAGGALLGEDAATINERSEALAVAIVAPRESAVESKTVVELQARVPEGARLEAIDLYWNEQKLATFTAPPYRYELTLPSKRAFGYIRAVARDAAGNIVEDAKVINSSGSAEVVQVDAVELQVVVQDRAGHPVEGLQPGDFAVKEDGVPVAVEVRNDPNGPITVGLVLDVSGSMRVAMASAIDYATEFLRHSLAKGDQTFIVTIADEPSLYQPLTADLEHVRASIFDMQAGGHTALWDAVIYSLDQLRAVRGKRALLLFTDAVDAGSRATSAAAIQYAHEVGVPVYVVMLYTGSVPVFSIANASGHVVTRDADDSEVKKLARQSGGALIRFPRPQDLPKLFQQVRDDTRGAYALSFISKSGKKRTESRKLSVTVPGKRGAEVRAPSAYYPR